MYVRVCACVCVWAHTLACVWGYVCVILLLILVVVVVVVVVVSLILTSRVLDAVDSGRLHYSRVLGGRISEGQVHMTNHIVQIKARVKGLTHWCFRDRAGPVLAKDARHSGVLANDVTAGFRRMTSR